jgi:ubiquinone/menaquinone biosynthesis C-methylase UbiE
MAYTQDKDAERNSLITEEIDEFGYLESWTEESYSRVFRHTIEVSDLKAGAEILEVGCGSSAFGRRLAKRGYSITGIDISETAIRSAQKRSIEEGFQAHFLVADGEHMPFEDNSFDACCAFGVQHHFNDFSLLAREMVRVVRSKGYVFTSDPNRHNLHYYFAMERSSPVRFDKLTVNETPISSQKLEGIYRPLNVQIIKIDYTYRDVNDSKKKGFWYLPIIYKIVGFIVLSIKGLRKRILAFFIFNIVHFINMFMPRKYKANFILLIARKNQSHH